MRREIIGPNRPAKDNTCFPHPALNRPLMGRPHLLYLWHPTRTRPAQEDLAGFAVDPALSCGAIGEAQGEVAFLVSVALAGSLEPLGGV